MSRFSRARRRIGRPGVSWLDFKLGFRMLGRYPGLTLVAVAAMSVAIALGSLYFEGLNKALNPRLPSAVGDRVIAIRNWDTKKVATEEHSLYDFAIWREQVRTVDDLGAAVLFVRNLVTEDHRVEPVRGAEITASAFRLMGTPPLLGRTLTELDEQPTQPMVVVIGGELWRTRFASDPRVVGRTVKLGTATATIVGIMPDGFGFPVRARIWMPLRFDAATLAPHMGPAVSIFGRLAPGASIAHAQAELDTIAARLAVSHPDTHKYLKPRVARYGTPLLGGSEGIWFERLLYGVNSLFVVLLAIISVNIATLVFARSATRSWEIAVRNALGASRGRIVAQLFVEALVLASAGTLLGLGLAKLSLSWGLSLIGSGTLPFWITDDLSWRTVLYAALLTLVAASIVGILPALRVTKINVQEALRRESAAGSALRFGGFWTTVIILQVALTVAFIPLAERGIFESNRFQQRAEGIGADRYLTASVDMDREDSERNDAAFMAHARASFDELARRLRVEPGVQQITFADRLPVMDQFKHRIEVDTKAGAPETGLRTSTAVQVSRGFFAAFGTSVVAGRDFAPLDFDRGHVLIVNQSFAHDVLGDRNPIGRRIRIVRSDDSDLGGEGWYEIVGMVKDFGWQLPRPEEQSAMYLPRLPTAGQGVSLAVRVRDPAAFATRLRHLAFDVDPTIRLTDVEPLTQVGGAEARTNWALTGVAWLIVCVVLLLSATGVHALMAFTVSRRTREIGIRVALGARAGRIVGGIFSRAFLQIGAGLLVGSAVVAALGGLGSMRQILLLLGSDGLMLVVGIAACAVPLKRALRIDPTEALRADG